MSERADRKLLSISLTDDDDDDDDEIVVEEISKLPIILLVPSREGHIINPSAPKLT